MKSRDIQFTIYIFLLCIYTMFRIFSSSYLIDFVNLSCCETFINYLSCLGLFFVFLLQNKINVFKIFISIFLFFITVFASYYSGDRSIIITCLFIIAFPKGISLREIAQSLYKIYFFSVFFVVTCSMMGIIPDYVSIQRGIERHSLGFVSPNAFANTVTLGIMLWNLFSDRKKTWKSEIIPFLLLCIVNYFTDSRLAFLIGILSILFSILIDCKKIIFKREIFFLSKYVMILFSFLCLFGTIYFSKNNYSPIYTKIDSLFTGRLSWMNFYYTNYGIDLFGNKIVSVSIKTAVSTGTKWKGLDNSYILFSIKYGLFFLILFTLLYYFLGNYLKKTQNYKYAFYVILISIFGLTESILFTIGFNFSLLMVAEMLLGSKVNFSNQES